MLKAVKFKFVKTIVIARYKENIKWANALENKFEVIIYNKYSGSNKLPNIGREAHTYIFHILKNYENIPYNSINVFLQGNPFDHSRTIVKKIFNLDPNRRFIPLSDMPLWVSANGCPSDCSLPIKKFYENIIRLNFPRAYNCWAHGLFAVAGSLIKRKPKEFYENIMQVIRRSPNVAPYVLERLWSHIFLKHSSFWDKYLEQRRRLHA